MKLFRKITVIMGAILLILIFFYNISYASYTQKFTRHNLRANEELNSSSNVSIKSQINTHLSQYDYSGTQVYVVGENIRTWTNNYGSQFTATIQINTSTGSNGKTLYSGYIDVTAEVPLPAEVNDSQNSNDSQNPLDNPDYYKPTDTTGQNTVFINMGNIIIGTMRALGTVIAVVALMVIGLRYMFGSIEERANYKETMVPYLIGAVMLFTIPNILGIIYDLVKGINF